jgi:light-regulated signal transduction histidine kinase (bacteriophytochrome)
MKGHLHRLVPAVRRALAEAEEHKARKQAEEVLEKRTSQLEELNRELESFSYSVSHDLRAPLRAIDGYARLILKKQGDKFDEDTLSKFNVIRNSTQIMGQLIDDLLTFSRLGRQHMSITKLDMDAMMKEAWKELQVINPERGIRFTVKDTPTGYGDRALIKQVCINLLSNAIKFTKYMDDARIETGGRTDGDENVYFVKDNGVGFDMAYYDKPFGVFQRLHSSEDFEGTGVGLAIVQRIIHRHGGRVWAESKVNEGTCFYFSLQTEK